MAELASHSGTCWLTAAACRYMGLCVLDEAPW
jgi:hypothetical protein